MIDVRIGTVHELVALAGEVVRGQVARVDGAADACADLHREPARVVDLRDVQAAVRSEGEVDDRREGVEDERTLLSPQCTFREPGSIRQTREYPVGAGSLFSSPT